MLRYEPLIGRQDTFDISDNGRSIILEATLSGSISGAFLIDFDADCPWDLDGSIGPSELLANLGPCP